MPCVITGLQPTGSLHLGNHAGAIAPILRLQRDGTHAVHVMVATYHALTTMTDGAALRAATRGVVVDLLAHGVDPDRVAVYLQHDVPMVTELAHILACRTPMAAMAKMHAYKDKTAHGRPADVGLFTYPILQAADILAMDADLVPVGEDQEQHIEACRDIVLRMRAAYGPSILTMPAGLTQAHVGVLPGIDGMKMSKSRNNTIEPLANPDAVAAKVRRIVTATTPLEAPKDPAACPVHALFAAVAGHDDPRTAELGARYRAGGFGFGHAKQALTDLLVSTFAEARRRKADLLAHPEVVDAALARGAAAAGRRARVVLERMRRAVGL